MRKENELTRKSSSCPGRGQRLGGTGNPSVFIPPLHESPQDRVFPHCGASGDHAPPTNHAPRFSRLRRKAAVFWPAGGAVGTVSSGVRGRETRSQGSRAEVHDVGEGNEGERRLPGGQRGDCQRHTGTDTAQGGDRGANQSQL